MLVAEGPEAWTGLQYICHLKEDEQCCLELVPAELSVPFPVFQFRCWSDQVLCSRSSIRAVRGGFFPLGGVTRLCQSLRIIRCKLLMTFKFCW